MSLLLGSCGEGGGGSRDLSRRLADTSAAALRRELSPLVSRVVRSDFRTRRYHCASHCTSHESTSHDLLPLPQLLVLPPAPLLILSSNRRACKQLLWESVPRACGATATCRCSLKDHAPPCSVLLVARLPLYSAAPQRRRCARSGLIYPYVASAANRRT